MISPTSFAYEGRNDRKSATGRCFLKSFFLLVVSEYVCCPSLLSTMERLKGLEARGQSGRGALKSEMIRFIRRIFVSGQKGLGVFVLKVYQLGQSD